MRSKNHTRLTPDLPGLPVSITTVLAHVGDSRPGDVLQVQITSAGQSKEILSHLASVYPHTIFTAEEFRAEGRRWAYIYIKCNKIHAA